MIKPEWLVNNCWLLKGKCLKKQPLEYYGFVYRITVADSDDLPKEMRGRIYIGKKQFQYNRKTRLSKKKRKETGKRVKRTLVDSKWLGYYGSNKQLLEDIKSSGLRLFNIVLALSIFFSYSSCSNMSVIALILLPI